MAKIKRNSHVGGFQLAMFAPASEWEPPTELIDLGRAKMIGIDVEAKDPNLSKQGPGFIRGDAKPVGISLATEDGHKMYLPFDHEGGGNMDKAKVVEYVKAQVSRPDQIKVGANLMYELEALAYLGIEMKGPLADIQVAEPLLDEDRDGGYSLEQLSASYLNKGKSEDKLREAATSFNIDPKKDMWRLHSKFVGEYGEDDAFLPIEILRRQLPLLDKEKLMDVWKLESDLLPVLFKMRCKGIRVDLDHFEKLSGEMVTDENKILGEIWDETGYKVDPWSSRSLAVFLNQMGLGFYVQYTKPTKNHPQGQPSFTNEWFAKMGDDHPVFKKLKDFRVMSKMRRDFVDGLILNGHVRGRLHPQWHQLRKSGDNEDDSDEKGGARTGRITSSKPNLTQIPTRDPRWGKKIRRGFVADEGGKYCKNDFSSQEPRFLLHFAYLKGFRGAKEARQRYMDDPRTDYHQMTADLILDRTGRRVERRPAKDINLGSAYGMGFAKLARKLGLPEDEARALLRVYHEGVPYVKKLEAHCMDLVQSNGFIRTILGRKRRFIMWEPTDWKQRTFPVRSYDEAVERWGPAVQRADAHKALNALCQGSAADQTKRAIVLLDQEGLCPQIQVYDELGQTIWDERDAFRIKHIMEHAVEISIPHVADPAVGDNWADGKELR